MKYTHFKTRLAIITCLIIIGCNSKSPDGEKTAQNAKPATADNSQIVSGYVEPDSIILPENMNSFISAFQKSNGEDLNPQDSMMDVNGDNYNDLVLFTTPFSSGVGSADVYLYYPEFKYFKRKIDIFYMPAVEFNLTDHTLTNSYGKMGVCVGEKFKWVGFELDTLLTIESSRFDDEKDLYKNTIHDYRTGKIKETTTEGCVFPDDF